MRCDPLTRGWGFVGVAAHTLGTGEAQRLWGAGTEGQQAVVGVLVSGGTVTSAGGVYSFTSKVSGPHQCHHLGSDVLLKTRAGA